MSRANVPSPRRLATLFALVCLADFGVAGQEPAQDPVHEPAPTATEQNVLWQRGRAVMHPSNPLRLSGLEQSDNSMRAGTSALQKGNTATAGSNQDENYARTLAMVEDRAVFRTAPARAALPDADDDAVDTRIVVKKPKSHAKVVTSEDESLGRSWEIGAGIVAGLTLAAWLLTGRRD